MAYRKETAKNKINVNKLTISPSHLETIFEKSSGKVQRT